MEEQNNSTSANQSGFVAGLIVGGVAGAVLTLMFVGSKDEKLKKELKKSAREVLKSLPKIIGELEKRGKEAAHEVLEGVEEAVGEKPKPKKKLAS